MKKIIVTIISVFLLYGPCFAEEKPSLNEEKDRISYSLGFQIGGDFRQQGKSIDPDALLKGVEDALSSAEPQLSPSAMKSTLLAMKNQSEAGQRQQKQAAVEQYRGEGREFLAQNAKKEGVVVLPSGLQYKVITEGTGKTPAANDTVTVHYRGTLINGQEFYNSRRGKETPESFHCLLYTSPSPRDRS